MGAIMKVSDQIKAAGFKSAKELAQILDCSPRCLRDWEKDKPERFRIMLAGAAEIRRQEQARSRRMDPRGFYAEVFARMDDDKKTTLYAVFADKTLRTQALDLGINRYGDVAQQTWHRFHCAIPSSAVSWGFYNYSDFLLEDL